METNLLEIPELIDLALGSPEIGAVNFNILHALLHVMAREIFNFEHSRVELIQSSDGRFETILHKINMSSSIHLKQSEIKQNEYENLGKLNDQLSSEENFRNKARVDKNEIGWSVMKDVESKSETEADHLNLNESIDKKCIGNNSIHNQLTKIFTEQEKVLDKKQNFSSSNQEYLMHDESFDKCNEKTDIDEDEDIDCNLFRVSENNIDKKNKDDNEDLFRKRGGMEDKSNCETDINSLKRRLLKVEKVFEKLRIHQIEEPSINKTSDQSIEEQTSLIVDKDDVSVIINEMNKIKIESNQIKSYVDTILVKVNENYDLYKEIDDQLKSYGQMRPTSKNDTKVNSVSLSDTQFTELYQQILDINQEITELESNFKNQLEELRQMKTGANKFADVYDQLSIIKTDIYQLHGQINRIKTNNHKTNTLLENFHSSINQLSEIKLDKSDFEEMLTEKADHRMLQSKLSVETFDINQRKSEKTLNELRNRITDLDNEVNHFKLFKNSMDKEFIDNSLKSIEENLNHKFQLIHDRFKLQTTVGNQFEVEGSVTKSLYMHNVNCIACDSKVMMRMYELEKLPKQNMAHNTKSLQPEFLYNFDKLQKDINKLPISRNLNHFEIINKLGNKLQRNDIENQKQRTRYCGGSHTKMTNSERLDKGIGRVVISSLNKNKTMLK